MTQNPPRVVSLRHGTYDDGTRWHHFFCEWPTCDEDFILTEGPGRTRLLPQVPTLERADLQGLDQVTVIDA